MAKRRIVKARTKTGEPMVPRKSTKGRKKGSKSKKSKKSSGSCEYSKTALKKIATDAAKRALRECGVPVKRRKTSKGKGKGKSKGKGKGKKRSTSML